MPEHPAEDRRFLVHVDLDGARHIYRVHGWTYRPAEDPLFETGMRAALDFLAHHHVRATLFLVAEDLAHPVRRALVERAVAEGHEIASHGCTHRLLSRLPPAEQEREIVESRERIHSTLGVPVRGFRAPAFDIGPDQLEIVARAGYGYDSSVLVNRAFARRLGVPRIPTAPFAPLAGSDLLELPLPPYRPLPFPAHPSYALVLGEWYFRAGLRRAVAGTGPVVVLFHLTDFAAPLPTATGLAERVFTLSHRSQSAKLEACARMLGVVRHGILGTTTAAVLADGRGTRAATRSAAS